MNDNIKKMFVEVAEKAKKDEEIGEGALIKRGPSTHEDHYRLCPFRSVDIKDCPLCMINNL